MTPLGPSEIEARRRPFVILTIIGIRIAFGFCLSLPLAALVAESGVGLGERGDRALFEGGGYLLIELLRVRGDALVAAVRGLLPLLGVGLLVGSACNVALLIALDVREGLSSFTWVGRAWARLPAQLVVGAGAALVKVLLLLLASIAVGAVPDSSTNPLATTAAQVLSLLPFLVAVGAVGGFEDVAKAALVRHDTQLGEGLREAVGCARRRPLRAPFGWVPYAGLWLLAMAGVSLVTEALDVSRTGAWRVAAIFTLHQLVIALGVVCRAAWFARALRLVATR